MPAGKETVIRRDAESSHPIVRALRDRIAVGVPCALLLIVVYSQWPLLTGREVLCYRDLGTTQLPAWAVPPGPVLASASFGQPLSGNPNLLLQYPTVHRSNAVGLHQFVHWVLMWAGLWLFLSALGCSPRAAVFGACAFSLSGYVVSSASFLNGFTAIAWMPWILWSATVLRDHARPWHGAAGLLVSASLLLRAGEPTLGAMGIVVSVALLASRPMRLLAFAGLLVLVALLNLPFLRDAANVARESYRVVTGYGFDQAASASLHPARLLETIVPFLFGRPDRILAGAWWGFRVSRETFPYVYSLALGIVPLALALATLRWDRKRRLWIVVGICSLLVALGGYLPGAQTLYESIGFRALRYPIKAYLLTTLAVAVLGAFAIDELARREVHRVTQRIILFLGCLCLITACVAWARSQAIEAALVRAWWDPHWRTVPSVILEPIVAALPLRLTFAGAAFLLVLRAMKRHHTLALLIVLVPLDLGWSAGALLPRTSASTYEQTTSFVRAAASLGRVYERAGKDLDAVRRGAYGVYPSNDIRFLIDSGAAQGWALTGAVHGMTYAYDGDSDGSYTWRNDRVGRMLDERSWRVRLKWLRAAGVSGIIAYRLPELAGVTPIARTVGWGVPNVLYRIEDSLPAVRRYGRAVSVRSADEAIARFERPDFDPREEVIVEGAPLSEDDPGALVSDVDLGSGQLECRTAGRKLGYLFVARSFTTHVEARIDGRPARVFPANVHLIAIPVPAGGHQIRVRF